jgi:prolyl-tRNA editing enzyme YbaK/EbsC (Cys-tRNA(Pro) deacylase)
MSARLELLHPAVAEAIRQHGIEADVMECDPNLADTAAFCEHYKFSAEETCNAIVVAAKTDPVKYACCLVLSTQKLDVNKSVCQLLDVKRCSFATGEQTVATTDMQIGGVTPIGISDMPIFIDSGVTQNPKVVLGGGNRSSKLLIRPSELSKLPNARIIQGLGLPR